jgi:hypothetical protein
VQYSYPEWSLFENQLACHVISRKLCINSLASSVGTISQSSLIPLQSDMVNTRSLTRSSHPQQPQPMQPPPSAPGASNDPDLRDFLKSMAESMEVLRKQNEELNARESGLSTPARRTMRVPSRGKMRKTVTNLVARMRGHGEIGLIERSPRAKNLGVRRAKGLTGQDDTGKNPNMKGLRGLCRATRRQR